MNDTRSYKDQRAPARKTTNDGPSLLMKYDINGNGSEGCRFVSILHTLTLTF